MHKGSCLCGRVRYQYDGELGAITLCHCSQCRKAQGSAFVASGPVRSAGFRVIAGERALKEYESSPGKWRAFCCECGSPLYTRRDDSPGARRLRIGTLDTPVGQKPAQHIYVGSKAEWFDITDALPRNEGLEDGRR